MISKKSIISTMTTTVFAITLGTVSFSLAADNSTRNQFENKNFIVAQAHQHGQDNESGHGDRGKNKGEGGKHGSDKKKAGMMKEGHDYAHMIISHTNTLKLSDEQLGKIVRLHLKHEQEHKQLKEKLMKSMMAFKKESMQPNTSDAQLRKLGKDHADAFNAMVEHHVNERQAIHAVLSDAQRKELNAMKMDLNGDSDDHSHH